MELALISIDEIVSELKKRFDALIIYGMRKKIGTNADGEELSNYYDSYNGDQPTLIGLCDLLKDKIKKDWDNSSVNWKGED